MTRKIQTAPVATVASTRHLRVSDDGKGLLSCPCGAQGATPAELDDQFCQLAGE